MRTWSCSAVISTCFSSDPMSLSSNGLPNPFKPSSVAWCPAVWCAAAWCTAAWCTAAWCTAGEPHLASLAPRSHPAGQVNPPLPAPAGDQGVDLVDVPGGERAVRAARHDRRVTQHPRPDRGGQRPQPAGVKPGRVRAATAELCAFGEREVVEAFGVGAQLARGAGQRLGHARPERRLKRGQRLVAHPGPGEAEVAVMGILPGLEAQFGARGAGGGAAYA